MVQINLSVLYCFLQFVKFCLRIMFLSSGNFVEKNGRFTRIHAAFVPLLLSINKSR
jgi:hypothetical protein